MNVAGSNQAISKVMMAGCATPEPEREITSECYRIDCSIDRLFSRVTALRDRLGVVLRPCPSTCCEAPKGDGPITELGIRLRSYDGRLDGINDALEDILNRLEV